MNASLFDTLKTSLALNTYPSKAMQLFSPPSQSSRNREIVKSEIKLPLFYCEYQSKLMKKLLINIKEDDEGKNLC